MLYFMLLRSPHHGHPFGGNSCYLRVLATFTLVDSPLKWTCIIACPPGFHSMDLKLQKWGVCSMAILVVKPQQPWLKRFQDIGTFLIAHAQFLMSYCTSLTTQWSGGRLLQLTMPFAMSKHHWSPWMDLSNSDLSDPAPLKGNSFRHAQTQKTSFQHVAHIVNIPTTKFQDSILKTGGVTEGNVSHTNLCKFRSDFCFLIVYCE